MVGIFAEGRGDLAVITNILKGSLNIDRADIRYELPKYDRDQTDLSVMPEEQYSSWTVVKKVCQEREKIDRFFDNPIEQGAFIVVHLDTAERHREDYNVTGPTKNSGLELKQYCNLLRMSVINKVDEWLENSYPNKIAYAIAIEETDAWVLTIYDKGNKDTSTHQNPKELLNKELNRALTDKQKTLLRTKTFEKYNQLSSDFRKKRKLAVYMEKNESLKLFCGSLEAFGSSVDH